MSPVTLPIYDWSTGAGLEKTQKQSDTVHTRIWRLEVSTHRMFTETINTLLLLSEHFGLLATVCKTKPSHRCARVEREVEIHCIEWQFSAKWHQKKEGICLQLEILFPRLTLLLTDLGGEGKGSGPQRHFQTILGQNTFGLCLVWQKVWLLLKW